MNWTYHRNTYHIYRTRFYTTCTILHSARCTPHYSGSISPQYVPNSSASIPRQWYPTGWNLFNFNVLDDYIHAALHHQYLLGASTRAVRCLIILSVVIVGSKWHLSRVSSALCPLWNAKSIRFMLHVPISYYVSKRVLSEILDFLIATHNFRATRTVTQPG